MNCYSVTQLNSYIKNNLENDPTLHSIQVMGEISNFKNHSSGHFYFTLKDEQSRVNVVMFATYARKVRIKLEDGMKVMLSASIGVYLQGGTYQLYAYDIEPVGIGALYLQYEQLKKKLAAEGLFSADHKQEIPKFPLSIGVISAKEGAAIRDVITTIQRRWPLTKITLIPSLVQGRSATKNVCEALVIADGMGFDTIIVARGGGSIEDLWCFNEEIVARTVYKMQTPVISAVGHETDFTIIDYVSDCRAPTPTGAAELATPNINDVMAYFEQQKQRLILKQNNYLSSWQQKVTNIASRPWFSRPELLYGDRQMQLNYLEHRLFGSKDKLFMHTSTMLNDNKKALEVMMKQIITINQHRYATNMAKLDALSPLKVLERGYSIISKNNCVINDSKQVEIGDNLQLTLKNGKLNTKVISKEE